MAAEAWPLQAGGRHPTVLVVASAAGAELVVVSAGPRGGRQGTKACWWSGRSPGRLPTAAGAARRRAAHRSWSGTPLHFLAAPGHWRAAPGRRPRRCRLGVPSMAVRMAGADVAPVAAAVVAGPWALGVDGSSRPATASTASPTSSIAAVATRPDVTRMLVSYRNAGHRRLTGILQNRYVLVLSTRNRAAARPVRLTACRPAVGSAGG